MVELTHLAMIRRALIKLGHKAFGLIALWAPLTAFKTEVSLAQGGKTQSPAFVQWIPNTSGSTLLPKLHIRLTRFLSAKQSIIIEGGFTTMSQLSIHLDQSTNEPLKESSDGDDTVSPFGIPLREVRCSVKFDAWEESFEVTRFLDHPTTSDNKPLIVKTLEDYGDLCLAVDIDIPDKILGLLKNGGQLFAIMAVKQTSQEESARIKKWLIQQQSGMMQSLFSHMLGELTLSQTVKTQIPVPPYPAQFPKGQNPQGRLTRRRSHAHKGKVDRGYVHDYDHRTSLPGYDNRTSLPGYDNRSYDSFIKRKS